MRHLAAIAVTGSILLASGPAFAAAPQAMRTTQDKPITLKVEGLAPEGAFLSLALPGGGQFYQGDHLRGATYLGATLGATAGIAGLQAAVFQALSPGMFWSGEQVAFITVQGLAISWLVVGGLSAFDAYQAILSKQPPKVVAAPSPIPTATPAPLPVYATPAVSAPAEQPPVQPASPPVPDAETLVLDSYRLADSGDHWEAVTRLLSISDPAWLPKVRALLTAWGDAAGAQGLAIAREQVARGERAAARTALDQLAKLPLKSSLRQQESALRLQLGDRP